MVRFISFKCFTIIAFDRTHFFCSVTSFQKPSCLPLHLNNMSLFLVTPSSALDAPLSSNPGPRLEPSRQYAGHISGPGQLYHQNHSSSQNVPSYQYQPQQYRQYQQSGGTVASTSTSAPPPTSASPSRRPQVKLHQFTHDEATTLQATFAEFDVDFNNRLSLTELREVLKRLDFPYSDKYITRVITITFTLAGKNLENTSRNNVRGMISEGVTRDEFILFMQIFMTLHDQVKHTLKLELEKRTGTITDTNNTNNNKPGVVLSPALISQLLPFVRLTRQGALDFARVRIELDIALGLRKEDDGEGLDPNSDDDGDDARNPNLSTPTKHNVKGIYNTTSSTPAASDAHSQTTTDMLSPPSRPQHHHHQQQQKQQQQPLPQNTSSSHRGVQLGTLPTLHEEGSTNPTTSRGAENVTSNTNKGDMNHATMNDVRSTRTTDNQGVKADEFSFFTQPHQQAQSSAAFSAPVGPPSNNRPTTQDSNQNTPSSSMSTPRGIRIGAPMFDINSSSTTSKVNPSASHDIFSNPNINLNNPLLLKINGINPTGQTQNNTNNNSDTNNEPPSDTWQSSIVAHIEANYRAHPHYNNNTNTNQVEGSIDKSGNDTQGGSLLPLTECDLMLLGELARLHDEEIAFIHSTFDLFLRFFDRSKLGALRLEDMRRAMTSLGLATQEHSAHLLAARAEGGVVSRSLFYSYYRLLHQEQLKKGFELYKLIKFFQEFDANGDGIVTTDEFKAGLKEFSNSSSWTNSEGNEGDGYGKQRPLASSSLKFAPISAVFPSVVNETTSSSSSLSTPSSTSSFTSSLPSATLSNRDITLLASLADANGDGVVSPAEFTAIFTLLASSHPHSSSTSATPSSFAPSSLLPFTGYVYSSIDLTKRIISQNDRLALSRDVAALLISKLVRSRQAPPYDSLTTFAFTPSHYRPSLLAQLDHHNHLTLATRLHPLLDHTGLTFRSLRYDPDNNRLHPIPVDLRGRPAPLCITSGSLMSSSQSIVAPPSTAHGGIGGGSTGGAGSASAGVNSALLPPSSTARILDPMRSGVGLGGIAALPSVVGSDHYSSDLAAAMAAAAHVTTNVHTSSPHNATGGNNGGMTSITNTTSLPFTDTSSTWMQTNPNAALRGDELGRWGAQSDWCAFEVSLDKAVGIPLPDINQHDRIAALRVRCILFEQQRPVSNMHIAKASFMHKTPDEWIFTKPSRTDETSSSDCLTSHWQQFMVKTDRPTSSLLFELTVLLTKSQGRPLTSSSSSSSTSTSSTSVPLSQHQDILGHRFDPEHYFELSAGWCQVDVSLADMIAAGCGNRNNAGGSTGEVVDGGPFELKVPIHGGSFFDQEPVLHLEQSRSFVSLPNLLLSRNKKRTGLFGLGGSNSQDSTGPVMHLTVTPLDKVKAGKRVRELLQYAPMDAIFPTNLVRVLRVFREIQAEELAVSPTANRGDNSGGSSSSTTGNSGTSHSGGNAGSDANPSSLSVFHSPILKSFYACAEAQDTMQVLAELWDKARGTVGLFRRRDVDGATNSLVKSMFRLAVLKLLPILSAAQRSLPPLVIGASDATRIVILRSIASDDADPLLMLSNDGLYTGWVRGRGRVSIRVEKVCWFNMYYHVLPCNGCRLP